MAEIILRVSEKRVILFGIVAFLSLIAETIFLIFYLNIDLIKVGIYFLIGSLIGKIIENEPINFVLDVILLYFVLEGNITNMLMVLGIKSIFLIVALNLILQDIETEEEYYA